MQRARSKGLLKITYFCFYLFFFKLMQSCLQVDLDTRLLNLYPNNKSDCTQPKLMY